jgi:hypothetical protein
MFRLIVIVCFTLPFNLVQAQKLYTPRDIQKAYNKGTRSMDGRPGNKYWQNRAYYNISLSVAPPNRTIQGSETITYFNNSPDTLPFLAFKLIVNIHKPGAPRLGGAQEKYLTQGVHIDSFLVNGKFQPWNNQPYYFTTVPVKLDKPLNAHDSVQLSIKWHYDVSLKSNREGMIDSTSFFLAYCYPRVAVYDDYQGWDFTDFNDALEFYNDFNDYSVQVQVPKNYLVWGTGTLLNPTEVLQPAVAKKFSSSLTADDVIHVVSQEDINKKQVTAQNPVNTWKFSSRNVPDVAFGISDHFVWDASSVVVDRKTGRRASAQAAFNDTAADFHHVVHFAKGALDWLSNNWPGIPYPYEKTTVFQGYAGMEYPMMANDETYDDTLFSRFVAMHEIAHSYMPFYMGINETRYGFMDEGWATTFECLFNRDMMGMEKADDWYKQFRVQNWINDPSQSQDLPIITPGANLSGGGLGINEYGKPSLGYLAIKDMLGDGLFKKCLHDYMDRWNGKHPLPWDFFYSFNRSSGQDLNWFWNNWFFSHNYIDLAIKNVSRTKTGSAVTIDNIGGMAAPFDLYIHYKDGTSETQHQSAAVWKTNQQQAIVKIAGQKELQSIKIDGGLFMDADIENNKWPVEKKAANTF